MNFNSDNNSLQIQPFEKFVNFFLSIKDEEGKNIEDLIKEEKKEKKRKN